MDFSFSEEQDELRAQARSFLAERFPADRVAELADSAKDEISHRGRAVRELLRWLRT